MTSAKDKWISNYWAKQTRHRKTGFDSQLRMLQIVGPQVSYGLLSEHIHDIEYHLICQFITQLPLLEAVERTYFLDFFKKELVNKEA